MHEDDVVRVRHILDAARKACSFTENRARGELDSNEMLSLSLVRLFEVIGEAANRVSPEYRTIHPGIPWEKMIGMRNRLIHGYFDVDLDVVWDTVKTDFPPLIRQLETILHDS